VERRNVSRRTSDKGLPSRRTVSITGTPDPGKQYAKLNRRERSVLQAVAGGYNCVEIARNLQITPAEVEACKTRIARKVGVAHKADYLRVALRLGLIGKASQGTITTGSHS
jgi:DNA-binding NarL/FixJ family response regulator